jgi:hypothetical protein
MLIYPPGVCRGRQAGHHLTPADTANFSLYGLGTFGHSTRHGRLKRRKKYAHERVQFFPKPSAFNIGWHEQPKRRISSFAAPRGVLTKPGYDNHEGDHSAHYPGFPALAAAANAFGE